MGIRTGVVSVGETPVANCHGEALPSIASEDVESRRRRAFVASGRAARVLMRVIRCYPLFDVTFPVGARKGAR